ncbi:peptidylprolyl isomerase [Acanthopleuribacter pedis]|uniref:Peptidyl-prolyl cis-trans isomerase n=1 Tax=Acanthopleuribacter pedis TaxID=442870 RepID=A0A8J7U617_9BACT|nr:peptidylprolyl isomerase [Acanthopleuribacter pedis]MBO1319881.1 peptidylprolyl isomerase [Acanthopleuribacter pedis]
MIRSLSLHGRRFSRVTLSLFLLAAMVAVGTPTFAGDGASADLSPAKATAKAPETFRVRFETTEGNFEVDVTRAWAPLGVDRFYNLVKMGYFTDVGFYRVIDGFMVQFGFHGDPKVNDMWHTASIKDDPVTQSNQPGMLTFANRGRNTRTTQMFINTANNNYLDGMGFAPLGKIVGDEGMAVVAKLYKGYGEGAPMGSGPNQAMLKSQGNAYLKKNFPELSYIKKVVLVKQPAKAGTP